MRLMRSWPIFCIFLLLNALPTPTEVDPDTKCPVLRDGYMMSAKGCGLAGVNCPCATRNYWFACANRLSPDPCEHLQGDAADKDSFNAIKFIIECVWMVLKVALPGLVLRMIVLNIHKYRAKRKQKAMQRKSIAMFSKAIAEWDTGVVHV